MSFGVDGDGNEVFFTDTLFLLFCQTLTNALAACITLLVLRTPGTNSVLSFAPVSLTYIGAMLCSNMSLQYIDYPTQVLGKSCKPLSVLLVGALVWRRSFPAVKYFAVLLMTAGISLFMLQKARNTHGGAHAHDPHHLLVGRAFLVGSLLFDGATGALQDKMVGNRRPSAYHMMMYNNLWAALYLFVALVATGKLQSGLAFVTAYPDVITPMLSFALCSAAGQMFIFYTVRHHGSLQGTMITTTRKFFTILLSVVWFGHELATLQWLAVAIVFAGLGIDIYFSAKAKAAAAAAATAKDADKKKE